jgi:tetratricopeptide (TPR) repeat protein
MDEAVVLLETVVSLDPLFAEIHADLAYCLLRAGQYQQAKIIIDRATLLGADNPFYQYIKAETFLFRGELEPAWQAMVSVFSDDEYTQGFYLDIQMLVALAQDDASRVDYVLDRYGVADSQSLGPIFTRGLVYLHRDKPDKLLTLIEEFQQSLQIAQRERPDSEATLLGFVHLYGLQKDQARLAEAVKAYYAGVKPDALRIVENRSVPIAYTLAGDTEGVLSYLDELVAQYGPWEFYYFTIDPVFDGIRNLPRFQALDKQYRQWLEQQ